jgi:dihydroceramide fatty acyl 2-hydroxylase
MGRLYSGARIMVDSFPPFGAVLGPTDRHLGIGALACAVLHHVHHAAPRAYVGTPTWASLLVLAGVFFVPIWRLLSLNVAFGALSGLISGWLWYGIVHHVIHHRRPRWLAIALRAASHRHFRHHSPHVSGNFGVTTAVWDYLLGTKL